jgi:energy-coupling factor transporter ATP-binding protein EcfA2
MKLLRISCLGVRGVPDGAYAFTDPRTGEPLPIVLVTGAPGSGKTSLLETIAAAKEAIGAYGAPPHPRRLRRPGADEARIVTTWRLSDAERSHARIEGADHVVTWDLALAPVRTDASPALRRLFAEFSRAPGIGKLEYFPANRALANISRAAFGRSSREAETRCRAVRAADKYSCLIEGLRDVVLDQASRALLERQAGAWGGALDPFAQALASVLPELRLAGFDLAGGGLRFERNTHEDVTLDELSDSEQQGVLFALAFRYFALDGSVVLIDEPELHLHAAVRARFLDAVAALGLGNQLLVATGSTELLRAADRGCVIELSPPVAASRAPAVDTAAALPTTAAGSTAQGGEQMATERPTPSSGADMLVSSIPVVATLGVPRIDAAPSSSVPSYLQGAPAPPAIVTRPPATEHDDATLEIQGGVFKPALPFAPPAERAGENITDELPAWEGGAPGKRLIRFDPQTGQPLPKPAWVDAPEPPSRRR